MEYINANKLKVKIERLYDGEAPKHDQQCDFDDGYFTGISRVFDVIDSLKQEEKSVAERFARIVHGNLIGIDKEVQQKFEQLYFEVTGNKMYGGYND